MTRTEKVIEEILNGIPDSELLKNKLIERFLKIIETEYFSEKEGIRSVSNVCFEIFGEGNTNMFNWLQIYMKVVKDTR